MARTLLWSSVVAVCFLMSPLRADNEDAIPNIGKRMMQFYQEVSAENFAEINAAIVKHQDAIVEKGKQSRFDLLAATFLARAHGKFDFEIEGSGPVIDLARDITSANPENKHAVFVNDETKITPSKLDVWWVSFFTTGEIKYLELLLRQTGDVKAVQGNLNKTVVRRAANWSFKSNCKRNDVVREFAAEAIKNQRWAEQSDFLHECLEGK